MRHCRSTGVTLISTGAESICAPGLLLERAQMQTLGPQNLSRPSWCCVGFASSFSVLHFSCLSRRSVASFGNSLIDSVFCAYSLQCGRHKSMQGPPPPPGRGPPYGYPPHPPPYPMPGGYLPPPYPMSKWWCESILWINAHRTNRPSFTIFRMHGGPPAYLHASCVGLKMVADSRLSATCTFLQCIQAHRSPPDLQCRLTWFDHPCRLRMGPLEDLQAARRHHRFISRAVCLLSGRRLMTTRTSHPKSSP